MKPVDEKVRNPTPIDGLTILALSYLALPNLIFLLGWFRLPIALGLVCAMLHFLFKTLATGAIEWKVGYSRDAVFVILATSLLWSAFGGGSHFVYANPDWVVRDAVLGDLVHSQWPVHYVAADGTPLLLRSAIGFFLPPAVFGKLFGIAQLDMAVYVWTATGVLLFLLLLPLPKQLGWRLSMGLLLAVFFSGMDFLGQVISTESLPQFPLRLEWWVPLSYPSLTGQLLWAPNHCLAIWIGAALLFRHPSGMDQPRIASALLPLTLIWTPFAAIGLAPFALLGIVSSVRQYGWRIIPWNSLVSSVIFSVPIALFLLLDLGGIASQAAPAQSTTPVSYPLQQASLHSYLLFVCCEFLFLVLVLAPHVRRRLDSFILSVAILLALPLVHFGPSNDLLLRLCAPPLVVLLGICLQTLLVPARTITRSSLWIAWLFLFIGAHTAFNELWRATAYPRSKANYQVTLAERQGGQPASHYVGRLGSSLVGMLLAPLPDSPVKATPDSPKR